MMIFASADARDRYHDDLAGFWEKLEYKALTP
jgi:hypothetical protein